MNAMTDHNTDVIYGSEQGIKLLGLLFSGSRGQHMASQNQLA